MKTYSPSSFLFGVIVFAPVLSLAVDITSLDNSAPGQSWDTGVNWSDGNPAAGGNDYFISNGFTIRTPDSSGNYVFPGDSLTIESGGTLALKNSEPIDVNLLSTGGKISHFSVGLNPDTGVIRGTISLTNDLTFDTNVVGRTISVESAISGPGGIIKNGIGGLVLSSSNNTFDGNVFLAGGSLQLTGGNNRLPTSSVIDFTGSSTLDLTNTTQTISSFTTPRLTDVDLTVTGAGGSLIVNGASNLEIGPGGPDSTVPNRVPVGVAVDMDLSGLSSFTYDSSGKIFRVGMKASAGNTGDPTNVATVTLAASNNITANTLAVGDVAANSDGGESTLNLGTTNDIRVNTLNNGYSGRSDTTFGFASGLTDPTAMIRNTNGTSAVANWLVGNVATFNNAVTWTDTVDMTAGTLDAKVTNLTVGSAQIGTQTSRGGTENATFSMGKGTLEATTITLGAIGGTSATGVGSSLNANGTFILDHVDGVVKTSTLRFAQNTIASTSGTKSANGIFNLINGTLEAQDIQLGSQSGTATTTSAINWTNGTIRNTASADLTIDAVPITLLSGTHTFHATGSQTITANASSPISGSGGLQKTGSGTLRLNGTNTYDGDTNITEGTLALDSAASLGGGTSVNVSSGATLGGGGTINGTTTIQGIHSPGFSPGMQTFSNGLAYAASSSLQWEFTGNTLDVAGTDYDLVSVSGGDLTLNAGTTLALLASGVDYSQSEWAGSRDFTVIDFAGAGTSAGNFMLDTSGAGTFAPFGSWSSLNNSGDIVLSWTPVPEPSSVLLTAVMSALLLGRRRR